MRPAKLDWVRNEITRMRSQLRAQEREIRMLRRAGVPTAAAELLLSRMRAKVCREREALRKSGSSLPGGLSEQENGGTRTCRSLLSCINIPKEEDDDGYGEA